jgi:glycerophosphoryl diester phosphodiesterase
MARPVFDRPIAHRGLHDRAKGVIENTASAFEAAIAAGYHIECDIQLTSDGAPVVFHDDDLERLTGRKGKIRDVTLAELRALPLLDSAAGDRPQLFTEMLEQVAGRTLLQVELKQQRPRGNRMLAQKAAEAVAAYKGPLVFESFDPALITNVREFGFTGARGIITYRYNRPNWERNLTRLQKAYLRNLLHWPRTRFDFISAHEDSLDFGPIRYFHKRGMPVTGWTIRSREAERKALSGGADQIVFEGFVPGA